jgi:predicted dinucleotide-binding enzyme
MRIGLIGAGGIGQAIAAHIAKAGYELTISNRRGPESLTGIASQIGGRTKAGTRREAAEADVVFLAVRWGQTADALGGLPSWNGRILVDATNPAIETPEGIRPAELNGKTSSEVIAALAPGARVVKAGNTLVRAMLAEDPNVHGGHRVLFMSGNDAAAKKTVSEVLQKAGFAAVDLGALASGGKLQQFPGGTLPTLNLIKLG